MMADRFLAIKSNKLVYEVFYTFLICVIGAARSPGICLCCVKTLWIYVTSSHALCVLCLFGLVFSLFSLAVKQAHVKATHLCGCYSSRFVL